MAAAEKGKKKRATLSSFTILLIILVVLAIVTVIMSASGVEGVQGATLSQVLTAPVFGFQDAIGVCLFVISDVNKLKLERLYRSILPFLVPLILTLILVTYIPGIVTALPNALLS